MFLRPKIPRMSFLFFLKIFFEENLMLFFDLKTKSFCNKINVNFLESKFL
jgi:hypothetical protein